MTLTVDPTGGLGQAEMLRRLDAVASRAADSMFPHQQPILELISQSENTTYSVRPPEGEPVILRIHRSGYHSDAAIRSEHLWLEALRNEAGITTPKVLPAPNGATITHVATDGLPEGRACVFFEHLQGEAPAADRLVEHFPVLGEITARMHEHVLGWEPPPGFQRFHWNLDTAFGPHPHWGHWHHSPGVDTQALALLERVVQKLSVRLQQFGMDPNRYGLVHADMRLANLLVYEDEPQVIDFDDCGFSWLLYDLAATLSFLDHRDDADELVDAWLSGYQRARRLSRAELDEIPSFIMLRRMLMVAWIGSHAETELATALRPDYTDTTCLMAEKYLSRMR